MKKILVACLMLTFTMIILIGCSDSQRSTMIGIYLRSMNGVNLMIDESHQPIIMGNETGNEGIFDELKSGDKIEVSYDSIAESYPAQTRVYSCKLIEEGNRSEIPEELLQRLEEMGWSFD